MNILLVKENKLIYKQKEFEINDLFNNELYEVINENIDKYYSSLCIVNEIYLRWIQSAQAIMLFFEKNDIEIIKFERADKFLMAIIMDVACLYKIKVVKDKKISKIKNRILVNINIIGSMVYLLYQMIIIGKKNDCCTKSDKFSIIRTEAAKKKMNFLSDLDIKYENFKSTETIYNCFSRKDRIIWVLKAWVCSYSELKKYREAVNKFIGMYSSSDASKYYSKRIVHTLLYRYMLDRYFYLNKGKIFYTGNNLDRFAVIEEELAKKYKITTVCIPHGLEYGFKFPHCFTGDIFYTTSNQAAKHLNYIYSKEKFVFDEHIAKNMFSIKKKNIEGKKEKKVVFFTEPREVEVNLKIIDELVPLLKAEKIELYLKLHPKDKKTNYKRFEKNISFIEKFDEAISNNICFSRKSTTILEAIYNNSSAAAIIINEKDKCIFKTFPSLQDDKIKVFYSIKGLFEWLSVKSTSG